MVRKLKWSPRAKNDMVRIATFYKSVASPTIALKIIKNLHNNIKLLCRFPFLGHIEPWLEDYPQCFRSLVDVPNYKIVYWVEEEYVKIATIFDCRQAPERLYKIIEQHKDWICEEEEEYKTK